jgi:hypothetical protein
VIWLTLLIIKWQRAELPRLFRAVESTIQTARPQARQSGSPTNRQGEKGKRIGKGQWAGTDSAGISSRPQGSHELPGTVKANVQWLDPPDPSSGSIKVRGVATANKLKAIRVVATPIL